MKRWNKPLANWGIEPGRVLMEYRITDPLETVTFVEGHNQHGPNSLSHHTVFLGEDGERYIPKPGPEQIWLKLADVDKPIHDPKKFLAQAQHRTNVPTTETQWAAAYAPTTEIQRLPQKVLKPEWALK
jgi:hypothetical protein